MLALRIGRIEVAFETITVCHGLRSCPWPTNEADIGLSLTIEVTVRRGLCRFMAQN